MFCCCCFLLKDSTVKSFGLSQCTFSTYFSGPIPEFDSRSEMIKPITATAPVTATSTSSHSVNGDIASVAVIDLTDEDDGIVKMKNGKGGKWQKSRRKPDMLLMSDNGNNRNVIVIIS